MRKKTTMRKILSILLVFSVVMGLFPSTIKADASVSAAGSKNAAKLNTDGTRLEASSDIGKMVADKLDEKAENEKANDGHNIFSVEMNGVKANVSFETLSNAQLVVAIYNEAGDSMLAIGNADVSAGETSAEVTIDTTDMPQYFYLRAFLIDPVNGRPLCSKFETPNYTQEMQEFFSKKQSDFDQDKVLSLDNKDEDNFAVFSDSTTVITEKEGVNTVEQIDEDKGEYVFDNIDSNISELKKGDIFAYNYNGTDTIIVNVGDILIDGNKATITKSDDGIEEAFEYVRYEMTATLDDNNYDPADAVKYGKYNGLKDASDGELASVFEKDGDLSASKKFGFDYTIGEGKYTGQVKMEAQIGVSFKYYLSFSYQYVEFNVNSIVGVSIQFKGETDMLTLPLGKVNIPVAGLGGLALSPEFVIKLSGDITASGVMTQSVGTAISNKSGISDRSKTPTFKSELKVKATFFIGIKLNPRVYLAHDDVVNVGLESTVGVEIVATLLDATGNGSEKHDCTDCISGVINFVMNIKIKATLFKKYSPEYTPLEIKEKMGDFYYSFTHKQGGFSKCPYLKYELTVTVKDGNGKPVEGAIVNDSVKTNSNGVAKLILSPGEQTISAYKGSYKATASYNVTETTTSMELYIGGSGGDDNRDQDDEQDKYEPMVSAGGYSSAVVTSSGDLYTWGSAYAGDGSSQDRYSPVSITNNNVEGMLPSGEVAQVSMGYSHSAVVMKNGDLYMWGSNLYGQIGNGETESYVKVPKLVMKNVKMVACGTYMTAVIKNDGQLFTWGRTYRGSLGNGSTEDAKCSMPQKIMDDIESVSVSINNEEYRCSNVSAVDKEGNLYVWGGGSYYALGTGNTSDIATPRKIMSNIESASMGNRHGAAVTKDGKLYLWGDNQFGQLGNDTQACEQVPKRVASNVKKVSLSGYETMILSKDGNVYMCGWGVSKTMSMMLSDVQDISVGGSDWYRYGEPSTYHALAMTNDGSVYTWGRTNSQGQLGNGTTTASTTPQKISLEPDISELSSAKKSGDTAVVSAVDTENMDAAQDVDIDSVAVLADTSAKSGNIHSVSFKNLTPGEIYNFYSLKYRGEDRPFTGDNVLYIQQLTADGNGEISLDYVPTAEYDMSTEFVVAKTQNSIENAEIDVPDIIYCGGVRKVSPDVIYEGKKLTEGVDYELAGDLAGDVGEHTATISGKGLYTGTRNIKYNVIAGDCSKISIEDIPDVVYTGDLIKPSITAKDGKYQLVEDTDYTVSYQNNKNVGYGIVVVKGINGYSGKYVKLFNITERQLDEAASVKVADCEYTGKPLQTKIEISVDGRALVYGMDYKTSYADNTDIGTALVTITGIGNYSGSIDKTFEIKGEHKNTVLNGKKAATCTSNGYTGDTYCKDCGKKLKTGKTIAKKAHSYKWVIDKKATTVSMGKRHKKCSVCGTAFKPVIYLAKPSVHLQAAAGGINVSWNKTTGATGYEIYRAGESGKYKLIKNIQGGGTIKYADSKANVNGMKYSYFVVAYRKNGSVKYVSDGSARVSTYYISPVTFSIKKKTLTACQLSWKTNALVSGYQLQYSDKKNFSSGVKSVVISGRKQSYYTIRNLKQGTKYYIRVRAYRKVGTRYYYSSWR